MKTQKNSITRTYIILLKDFPDFMNQLSELTKCNFQTSIKKRDDKFEIVIYINAKENYDLSSLDNKFK